MKIALFANTDWYLYNFRQSLAIALRDAGHEVLIISPPGPFGELLKKNDFHWIAAPMDRRSLNPLRELALLLWLKRVFQREAVDLVHSFTIKSTIYGSIAARLACVPARVNSVVGLGYVFINKDIKAFLLKPIIQPLLSLALGGNGACLILQNPDDVLLFEKALLVDPRIIKLIPGSGVDCQRFSPCESRRKTSAPFRVVLAARLLWDKGLAEYIDAAHELIKQGREIEFFLAGNPDSGNPASVPEATVQKWVNEGFVKWLGHVDDMPTLFRSMDAVVLPSYREGLPKSLIEAGACGLPLITTDVPGCREVVTDGIDGLLVPVRDSKALAVAISRLQDDPALAIRLGIAARNKVLHEFDERIVIERTISTYDELLQRVR